MLDLIALGPKPGCRFHEMVIIAQPSLTVSWFASSWTFVHFQLCGEIFLLSEYWSILNTFEVLVRCVFGGEIFLLAEYWSILNTLKVLVRCVSSCLLG